MVHFCRSMCLSVYSTQERNSSSTCRVRGAEKRMVSRFPRSLHYFIFTLLGSRLEVDFGMPTTHFPAARRDLDDEKKVTAQRAAHI